MGRAGEERYFGTLSAEGIPGEDLSAIDRLPEEYRIALEYRYLHEMSLEKEDTQG